MQTVLLGRTGLRVSVACLGAGGHSRLGQLQGASKSQSVALVQTALDLGINFIDTASAYGTEEIVGEAIRGRRNEVVISTKVTITTEQNSTELVTVDELEQRIHAGLKRLAVERVEILHLHAVAEALYRPARDRFVPVLDRLQRSGVIGFAGITERFGIETGHPMAAMALDDDLWPVLMVGYNLANQTAARDVLPMASQRGVGTLCMFAVRGALANPDAARALVEHLVATGEVSASDVDLADPLRFVLNESDAASLSEAAYRFCRHSDGIDVVLTGTGNRDHLAQNVAAIQKGPLPDNVVSRLKRIFSRVTSISGDVIAPKA